MAIRQGLQRAVFAGCHAAAGQELADAAGNEAAFLFKGRAAVVVFLVTRRRHDVDFDRPADPAFIVRSLTTGVEFFPFPIIHAGRFCRHGPREDSVHGVEDDRNAAEIPPQVDATLHGFFIAAEGLVFLQEQRRVGQAEAIDALLDIADHEAVVLTGNEAGNEFLDAVRILVFVDEDLFILAAQLFGCRRRHGMFRRGIGGEEDPQAEMFQVAEIDPALFLLRRPIGFGKIQGQRHQAIHDGFHGPHAVEPFFRRRREIDGLQGLDHVFLDIVAHFLAPFPDGFIVIR